MRAMLTPILALVITAVLVELARRVAPVIGLIDSPNERKSHQGDIPLVGGISIFTALVLVLAFRGNLAEHSAFFLSAGLLIAVGVGDDAFGISPKYRLLLQAVVVLTIRTSIPTVADWLETPTPNPLNEPPVLLFL